MLSAFCLLWEFLKAEKIGRSWKKKVYYHYINNALFFAADIISCVEFNHDGDLLATGDKGGRVVIFQRDPSVSLPSLSGQPSFLHWESLISENSYNV